MGLDFLQLLLNKLQQVFDSEEAFKEFINRKNKEGVTAFDYCQTRKRNDYMHHISQFADKVGHLIKVQARIMDDVDLQALIDESGTHLNREKARIASLDPTTLIDREFASKWPKLSQKYDLSKPMSAQIRPLEETELLWVDTPEQLQQATERIRSELKECPLLAVDLEYHNVLPHEERCEIISLIQISTLDTDYILDCFMLRNQIRDGVGQPHSLAAILADEEVVKILHGCDSDLKYLVADFGITCANVMDTARLFSFLQRIPPPEVMIADKQLQTPKHVDYLSLEKIVKLVLDVNLDKFFQVADWRIRPLPVGMLDYARCDSHYLIPAYWSLISLITGYPDLLVPPGVKQVSGSLKNDFV